MFDAIFLRFVLVGLINTAIGYALMLLLFHVVGLHYGSAYFISYSIGFIISFLLNRSFVFSSQSDTLIKFLKFLLSFGIAYAVSYAVLFTSVEHAHIETTWAFLLSMLSYSMLFYLLNRYFTFKAL